MLTAMKREIVKKPKVALCRRCGGYGTVAGGREVCPQCGGSGRVVVSCSMVVDVVMFKPPGRQ